MSNIFHKEDFSKVLAKHGMILQEHQLRQFEEYASMLIEWNQKINLTAITDPDEIYEKHFLDSILPSFDMSIQGSFCDVGAGQVSGNTFKNHISRAGADNCGDSGKKNYFFKCIMR